MQRGVARKKIRQDACRVEWQDGRQAGCMQRGVARRQAGRMHAEGSGQTTGWQDACRGEWPYGRQVVDGRQSAGRQLFFETGIFSQLYYENRNLK
jgi:hypothetical protein